MLADGLMEVFVVAHFRRMHVVAEGACLLRHVRPSDHMHERTGRITVKYYIEGGGRGTTVAQWLRCCATNRKVAGSIPPSVIGFFIDIKFFRSHYGSGIGSASNRNEYQEYFLGVKAACA